MNGSVVSRLILKDLYLHRWLIIGALFVGLTAVFVSGVGGAVHNIAWFVIVASIVTLGVFLAIYSVLIERQSKSLLFVLSLPVSPMQYTTAKITAALIAFLIPWVALTGTILVLIILLDPPPDGRLPFTVTMMLFFLANFCILIAVGFISGSEYWGVAGILATNLSIPVFMSIILPRVTEDIDGPVAVWNSAVLTTLGVEATVIVLSLALTLYVQSRRTDHV